MAVSEANITADINNNQKTSCPPNIVADNDHSTTPVRHYTLEEKTQQAFNPIYDVTLIDFSRIKECHLHDCAPLYIGERKPTPEEKERFRRGISLVLIHTPNGKISFEYGTQRSLDRKLAQWRERKYTVQLTIYQGLSFESSDAARKLYAQTNSLESVERFLTREERADIAGGEFFEYAHVE